MVQLIIPQESIQGYRGRFAPSPSGPLHLGSLVAALGSYFRAKQQDGLWLLRIEDIDPPREPEGAAQQIIRSLEQYGLQWDESIFYQSQQTDTYQAVIHSLIEQHKAYKCQCTRKQLKATDGQCHCAQLKLSESTYAVRFKYQPTEQYFDDQHLQRVNCDEAASDFTIKRRDGLYAYQLAVVVDDIQQGITEVVRGADLLETTPKQLALYRVLEADAPDFLHLPIVVSQPGLKLSKQNHSPAIPTNSVDSIKQTLIKAMSFLGLKIDNQLQDLSVPQLLDWGIKHWNLVSLPQSREIQLNSEINIKDVVQHSQQ